MAWNKESVIHFVPFGNKLKTSFQGLSPCKGSAFQPRAERSAAKQFVSILNMIAESLPVEIIPALSELSVAQAATFLKMSENHLNDLLDENLIASRMEGRQRVIPREALLDYLERREKRQAILDQMTQEA